MKHAVHTRYLWHREKVFFLLICSNVWTNFCCFENKAFIFVTQRVIAYFLEQNTRQWGRIRKPSYGKRLFKHMTQSQSLYIYIQTPYNNIKIRRNRRRWIKRNSPNCCLEKCWHHQTWSMWFQTRTFFVAVSSWWHSRGKVCKVDCFNPEIVKSVLRHRKFCRHSFCFGLCFPGFCFRSTRLNTPLTQVLWKDYMTALGWS